MSAGLISSEPRSMACRRPSSRVITQSSSVCVLIATSSLGYSHSGLGPAVVTSFNLNYFFNSPVSKYSHILGYWG